MWGGAVNNNDCAACQVRDRLLSHLCLSLGVHLSVCFGHVRFCIRGDTCQPRPCVMALFLTVPLCALRRMVKAIKLAGAPMRADRAAHRLPRRR